MDLNVDTIREVSNDLREICFSLSALENSETSLIIGIDEIAEITGWSKPVIRRFMHRPDFPLIKVGKNLQVNKLAFIKYTMQRCILED